MTSDIIQHKNFNLTPTGIEIKGKPSFDEWFELGGILGRIEGGVHWWLGDWCNYGEAAYGEKYSQALDETTFAYDTLAGDAYVCKQIESCRRRQQLSFSHHKEVAALAPKEADNLLDKAEAENWTRQQLRQAKRKLLPAPELPKGTFNVIYADPPWKYGQDQHGKESQETVLTSHYPVMETDDICQLNVASRTAPNAVLFLWVTSPKLFDANLVINAWGFAYKTSMIWDKVKHNVGYYVSVRHEILLIATKGSYLPENKKLEDSVQTIERSDRHSEKPAQFRKIIETMYPKGKKLELFARKQIAGWTCFGNEL